jgi:hypothetical protein
MEILQPQYLSVSYYQPIIKAIESHFGKYEYTPRVVITPGLYKMYGALGETQFIKTADGQPVLIQIDADIWHNRPQLGLETLVHELLEWKAVEMNQPYPHAFAEQYTPMILSEVTATTQLMAQPISILDTAFLRFPILRRILFGE